MRAVLPLIVISQFLCTSVWFSGNAIASEILTRHQFDQQFLAHLTSAIQFGFISGTLLFAVFMVSDRFSPSRVFFYSALSAAIFNLGISFTQTGPVQILVFRFLTGFCLAGIYPVGMKIVSDHYERGLGRSLGFLVGALVLGTAFPHLLKDLIQGFPWQLIVYSTSALCVTGGLMVLLGVGDGPFRSPAQEIRPSGFTKAFKQLNFRSVSLGYFGHMWELYTFWAFLPAMLTMFNERNPGYNLNVSLLSFLIIATGAFACVISGMLSRHFDEKKLAFLFLSLSACCCIVSPAFLTASSGSLFVGFLFFWGFVVIADSPLFSTLVARHAPKEVRGSSLTIVNCVGFAITIVSIQFIALLSPVLDFHFLFLFLAFGPVLGLTALLAKEKKGIAKVE